MKGLVIVDLHRRDVIDYFLFSTPLRGCIKRGQLLVWSIMLVAGV